MEPTALDPEPFEPEYSDDGGSVREDAIEDPVLLDDDEALAASLLVGSGSERSEEAERLDSDAAALQYAVSQSRLTYAVAESQRIAEAEGQAQKAHREDAESRALEKALAESLEEGPEAPGPEGRMKITFTPGRITLNPVTARSDYRPGDDDAARAARAFQAMEHARARGSVTRVSSDDWS